MTAAAQTASRPAVLRARPRVLLLDDEESILLPTAAYFRSRGCEVDTAREPEEAEALVQHRGYDLAILDLRVAAVGGAAGLEVLRELRRQDDTTHVIAMMIRVETAPSMRQLMSFIGPPFASARWYAGRAWMRCSQSHSFGRLASSPPRMLAASTG